MLEWVGDLRPSRPHSTTKSPEGETKAPSRPGGMLVHALNTVNLGSGRRKEFFPGWLGIANVIILALIAGVLYGVTTTKNPLQMGLIVGGVSLAVLSTRAGFERYANKSPAS